MFKDFYKSFFQYYDLIKKIMLFCITAILIYYVYTLFRIDILLIWLLRFIFPFIIALFIHFILDPIIDYFVSDRISRKVVVIHFYICLSVIAFLIAYCIAPYACKECISLYESFHNGGMTIPPLLRQAIEMINEEGLTKNILNIINNWTQSFIGLLTNMALGIGVSFYLSYDDIHVIDTLINYLPFDKQSIYRKYLKKLKLMTFAFMKSLLLDFMFFFVMCLIPFFFIDHSYFIWISLFISITNLIPYVGPYIGGIPVVIYEFMSHSTLGYITFVVVIVLQYLESSFLQPYLFQKCIDIHPIILFFSLNLFGDLLGIAGMVFSPLLAVYCLEFYHFIKEVKLLDHMKRMISKT